LLLSRKNEFLIIRRRAVAVKTKRLKKVRDRTTQGTVEGIKLIRAC
jgi:hypothetical protein